MIASPSPRDRVLRALRLARAGAVLLFVLGCGEPPATPDAGSDAGGCTADAECGDGVMCTVDRCVAGVCESEPCADCCADPLVCVPDRGCAVGP